MNFIFMLGQEEPLLQKSISTLKEWDFILQADSTQIADTLRDLITKWVRETQSEEDDDLAVHKISLSELSSSAIFTGDSSVFDPDGLTDKQYDALSVQIRGAVREDIQYPVSMSDLKTQYESRYSGFMSYAKEHLQFVPETDGLREACRQLTEQTVVFFDEMSAAYQYLVFDKRDTTEMKALVTDLMDRFNTSDALITQIRETVLSKEWQTSGEFKLATVLEGEDEEKVYGDIVTLDYTREAETPNNAAWSMLQYVISSIEDTEIK